MKPKSVFTIFSLLFIFSACKKEDNKTTTSSSNPSATTALPKYAAQFIKNSNVYPGDIHVDLAAWFYDEKGKLTKGGSVLCDQAILQEEMPPNGSGGAFYYDSYSGSNSSLVYGGGWKITSIPGFPDTIVNVIHDGIDTFQPETSRVYDKTKDFTITFPYMNWDTLAVTLGAVVKKITYTMEPVSVTFTPSDKVSTAAGVGKVSVTLNYKKTADIKVRNRPWNFVYTFYNESFYTLPQ